MLKYRNRIDKMIKQILIIIIKYNVKAMLKYRNIIYTDMILI